jgi:hypothetical protein
VDPSALDIFLDDDFTGLGIPAPPPGDTMEVKVDTGPVLDQLNIPATGALINDLSITATKAGHTFIIGKVIFRGASLGEIISLYIVRDGTIINGSYSAIQIPAANYRTTLVSIAAITDAAIGNVFRMKAYASASTADINATDATLITVTA